LGRDYKFEWATDNAGRITSGKEERVMTATWGVTNGTEYARLKTTVAGLNCSYTTPLPASPADLGFVKIIASPTPNITGNSQVCAQKIETYQTPVTGNEYQWTVENGEIIGLHTQAQVTVNWAENTGSTALVGKLKLTEKTTSTNCQKDATFEVSILPRPVLPASPDRTVCAVPIAINLSAVSAGATSYTWYDAPIGGNPLPNNSPTITANVSFWVTAMNANGCESERKEVKITINPNMGNIVINPTIIHATECVASGDSPSGKILLEIIGNNPPYSFAWSKIGSTFTAQIKDITNLTKGDYQVTIKDAGGCITTSPVYTILEQLKTIQNPEIVYNGKVLADNEQIVVAQGLPTSLRAQATEATQYEWKDEANIVVGTEQNYTITPQEQGDYSYTIKITNDAKCSAERKVRVKVVGLNVYVPNIFSPNQDNQNDKLQVYGNGIKSVNFKVYNRLGEMVYETDKWVEGKASDSTIGWDGFYKGKLQESGNYTWIISVTYINNQSLKSTGNIYLKY
jgi:gliding motility-associated-like protein